MQPHDDIRLRHMIDSSQEAIEFAAGKTWQDLDDDRKLLLPAKTSGISHLISETKVFNKRSAPPTAHHARPFLL